MRPVTLGDLCAAARAVLMHPVADRDRVARALVRDAHLADRYRQRFGRAHPRLGPGTLMAVALARQPKMPPAIADRAYLLALRAVLDAVLAAPPRDQMDNSD